MSQIPSSFSVKNSTILPRITTALTKVFIIKSNEIQSRKGGGSLLSREDPVFRAGKTVQIRGKIANLTDQPTTHCPRCRGLMRAESDRYGSFSTCLTCGYVYEPGMAIADIEELEEEESRRRRQPSHGDILL